MNDHQKRIYLDEMKSQCKIVLELTKEINVALREKNVSRVFWKLHDLVNHAAIISKMLWPPVSSTLARKARGNELCNFLQLTPEHPVAARNLRNHLEHFDERLDDWVVGSSSSWLVDRNIGKPSRMVSPSSDSDCFRNFDPEENIYHFRGEQFDIQKLVNGISEIASRLPQ